MLSDSFCLWLILKLKESVSPNAHVKLKSFWTFFQKRNRPFPVREIQNEFNYCYDVNTDNYCMSKLNLQADNREMNGLKKENKTIGVVIDFDHKSRDPHL